MSDHNQTTTQWRVGQKAVINQSQVVTIERVTPSGRATAYGRTFNSDGTERTASARPGRLEPMTDEMAQKLAFKERCRQATADVGNAVVAAERFVRTNFPSWGNRVASTTNVEIAERLAAAIKQVLGDGQ